MARVKITDNTVQVLVDKKIKTNRFLNLLTSEVIRVSVPITPKKEGDLRRPRKEVLGTKAAVAWEEPYAQYQERGMRADGTRKVRNYTTAGTSSGFAKKSVNQAIRQVQSFIKQAQL